MQIVNDYPPAPEERTGPYGAGPRGSGFRRLDSSLCGGRYCEEFTGIERMVISWGCEFTSNGISILHWYSFLK